jgi:hypothetical protein
LSVAPVNVKIVETFVVAEAESVGVVGASVSGANVVIFTALLFSEILLEASLAFTVKV